MSTDLYRIRVLALDPAQRKVNLRVFLVYYDWSGVPTDASFFLRVLWDEADTRFDGGGPLGDEITVEQICSEEFVDENTHRYVERVTKLSGRNDPLPPGQSPPTFVYEGFKNEDVLTQGDYEVVVTDARWMAHLKVDQVWQTTAYETRAKMPAGRETLRLDAPAAAKKGAKKPAKKAGAAKTAVKAAAKKTVKAGAKKTAAKKVAAKKTVKAAAKKTAAKKTAAKKTVKAAAKKTAAKKTAAKKTVKAGAKKTAAKKTAAKKTAAKKTAAKKTAVKKTAATKTAATKAAAKKTAAKRA